MARAHKAIAMIKRPQIVVSQQDHEALIDLALRALGRAPGAALLLQEMERATVVSDPPQHVLAMNGKATFDYDGRLYRDFHLVYPPCADFTAGRISVLTPVGAALIGLAEGKTLSWKDDARVEHSITVRAVQH